MAEEIDLENGRISNFQCHVTLTLDRTILHTVVHHSSTSTYTPNFIRIGMDSWTDIEAGFIRSTRRRWPNKGYMIHRTLYQATLFLIFHTVFNSKLSSKRNNYNMYFGSITKPQPIARHRTNLRDGTKWCECFTQLMWLDVLTKITDEYMKML